MKLEDTSMMPFGKYAGVAMQDVPVSYLHWLWCSPDFPRGLQANLVHDYIKENLDALKMENEDLIWSRK